MSVSRTLAVPALILGLLMVGTAPAWADEPAAAPLSKVDAADLLIEGMKSKDSEVRLRAAVGARTNDTPALTKPLIKLIADEAFLVRQAAIEALGTRTDKDGKKKGASALAARLARLEKMDGGRDELLLALASLRTLAQPAPIKTLMKGIKNDSDLDVVEGRLYAVAAVPSKVAIEELIKFLAKGGRKDRPGQKNAAVKALRWATGVSERQLKADPDRWRAWWKDNEKTFDFDAIQAARAEAAAQRAEQDAKRKERAEKKKAKKREKQNKKKGGAGKPKTDNGTDA